MKAQTGTIKKHKNPLEIMKSRPVTMKSPEYRPGTMKTHETDLGQ